MKKIILDTRKREEKEIRLVLDGVGEKMRVEGDILASLEKLLLRRKLHPVDLDEITMVSGPGSFTGLRVGAAIVNTLTYAHSGSLVNLIIPEYGKKPNISLRKKKVFK